VGIVSSKLYCCKRKDADLSPNLLSLQNNFPRLHWSNQSKHQMGHSTPNHGKN